MAIIEFIETSVFTEVITKLLEDNAYGDLQAVLVSNPEAGDLIPGGGGLRKLRWSSPRRQKGKRGGIRVIYYVHSRHKLYMIYAYDKSEVGDLTGRQLKNLRDYVKGGLL